MPYRCKSSRCGRSKLGNGFARFDQLEDHIRRVHTQCVREANLTEPKPAESSPQPQPLTSTTVDSLGLWAHGTVLVQEADQKFKTAQPESAEPSAQPTLFQPQPLDWTTAYSQLGVVEATPANLLRHDLNQPEIYGGQGTWVAQDDTNLEMETIWADSLCNIKPDVDGLFTCPFPGCSSKTEANSIFS